PPDLAELPALAPVAVASLRRELGRKDCVPAGAEVEHRRVCALDQGEVGLAEAGEPASTRQAEEVDVVERAGACALDDAPGRLAVPGVEEQEVGELGMVAAEERADTNALFPADEER